MPFRELPSVTGHAVRMAYLAAGAADVLLETGDRTLEKALTRLWDDMVATKLYITGGLGSRHSDEAIGDRYELPSERAYAETCAAIALMQWAWRMFLATGGASYLDVFERVLSRRLRGRPVRRRPRVLLRQPAAAAAATATPRRDAPRERAALATRAPAAHRTSPAPSLS